jgi:hypothetical protein
MIALIAILRDVHDPRDVNARHDCTSMLFVALLATLCGSKTCVESSYCVNCWLRIFTGPRVGGGHGPTRVRCGFPRWIG